MHSSETLTSNYYNFPKSKFAPGCNLNDVINSRNPFRNLGEDGTSHNDPYTIKVRTSQHVILFFTIKLSTTFFSLSVHYRKYVISSEKVISLQPPYSHRLIS